MMITNILGLGLIVFIVWWFWLYRPAEGPAAAESVVIRVENGSYEPPRLRIPAYQPTRLQFLRKDPSPCAEMVLVPQADVSAELMVDETTTVELPALKPGDYPFHCQMQMYRGILTVE